MRTVQLDESDGAAALDEAWSSPETFACIAKRNPIGGSEVAARLDALPTERRTEHFCLLTSGSTGDPKLVVADRRRAEGLVQLIHREQENEVVGETIQALPFFYSFAFVNQWLWSRVMGRRLVETAGFREPALLRSALEGANSAMLCLVGVQGSLLLQHYPGASFPEVIRVHFAGGAFPQEHLASLQRMFPNAAFFNNYGCTEAMPRLCVRRATADCNPFDIGTPLPGIRLSRLHSGELAFESPYACVGWVDVDGFVEAPSVLETGDVLSADTAERWILSGRRDDVIKRYGEKLSIPRVTQLARTSFGGSVAHYLDKDRLGESGYVLVLSPVPSDAEVRSVLRAYRAALTRAHWPLRLESVEQLPTLPSGKIDQRALQQQPRRNVHWSQP